MLAPPNAGSELADFLRGNPLYRLWFGPANAQLVTKRDEALVRLLGTIDYERAGRERALFGNAHLRAVGGDRRSACSLRRQLY